MRPSFQLCVLALTASASLACRGDHKSVRVRTGNAENVSFAKRDAARPLGPGDIRIATVDSAIEVALIGDSLVAGLGATTLNKARKALDTSRVTAGIGGSIEKMVKSTVAGALDHEMHMPLAEVTDIRYEDGLLVFYGRDGKRMHFIQREEHGPNQHRTRFTEDDAKDFIAIFRYKTGRA